MGVLLACGKEDTLDFLYILFMVTRTHLSRMSHGKSELQDKLGEDTVASLFLSFFQPLKNVVPLSSGLHDFKREICCHSNWCLPVTKMCIISLWLLLRFFSLVSRSLIMLCFDEDFFRFILVQIHISS